MSALIELKDVCEGSSIIGSLELELIIEKFNFIKATV